MMPASFKPPTQFDSWRDSKSQSRPVTYTADFDRLAEADPEFAAFYKPEETLGEGPRHQSRLNFQDPKAVQQLTKTILKVDFGLEIVLPDDRLCPPVPVRWNYIDWIEQLLDSTTELRDRENDQAEDEDEGRAPSAREIVGLDIGVGASCVYGLLACAKHPSWQMLGTDIDAQSLASAHKNIRMNHLEARIQLAQTTVDEPLLSLPRFKVDRLDFVMTNPPFYTSESEMIASQESKSALPSAICTGAPNEMICPGGDLGFVTRILEESLILRGRVQWYTAMLGKLSSLHALVDKLRSHQINNYAVASLQAGNRTKRWAIGWSFGDCRPRNEVARHADVASHLLPMATATSIAVPLMSAQWAGTRVNEIVQGIDVRWRWNTKTLSGLAEASENVWSRAARRKRKFHTMDDDPARGDGLSVQTVKSALSVRVVCEDEKVTLCWVTGRDQLLYQSFCGMLKRALTEKTVTQTGPTKAPETK